MQKKKTYFEQVPLDAIKEIVEEHFRLRSNAQNPANPKVETVEEEILLTTTGAHSGANLDGTV